MSYLLQRVKSRPAVTMLAGTLAGAVGAARKEQPTLELQPGQLLPCQTGCSSLLLEHQGADRQLTSDTAVPNPHSTPMLMEHLVTLEHISFWFGKTAGGQQTETQTLHSLQRAGHHQADSGQGCLLLVPLYGQQGMGES